MDAMETNPQARPGDENPGASGAPVCFVIVFFGRWPKWFSYFLRSCARNPRFHWIFFTDCDLAIERPDNVILHPYSKAQFQARVTECFGEAYDFSHGYKLCDFKPTYGQLFQEEIAQYRFWGYTDVDVVLGDLDRYMGDEMLDRYDVITASPYLVVGHCTIFRNNEYFRHLYRGVDDYQALLYQYDYAVFDEKFFANKVLALGAAKQIRFQQKSFQTDDCLIWWAGRPRFLILWRNGVLTDWLVGRELGYFHFIQSKHRDYFRYDPLPEAADSFYVDRNGLHPLVTTGDRLSFVKSALITFACTLPYYAKQALKRVLPASLRKKLRGSIQAVKA